MRKFILIFLIALGQGALGAKKVNFATITGQADFLKDGDIVRLAVYKFTPGFKVTDDTALISKVNNGIYSFNVELNGPVQYIALNLNYNKFLPIQCYQLLCAGDRINLSTRSDITIFRGKGSAAWKAQSEFLKSLQDSKTGLHYSNEFERSIIVAKIDDSITTAHLRFLKFNRHLKNIEKLRLQAEFCATTYKDKHWSLTFYGSGEDFKTAMVRYFKTTDTLKAFTRLLKVYESKDDLEAISNSGYYPDILWAKVKFKYFICKSPNSNVDILSMWNYINRNYSSALRDDIAVRLIYFLRDPAFELIDERSTRTVFQKALNSVKSPKDKQYIEGIAALKMPGVKAHDFTLTDSVGKVYHLSDFMGKAVFIDVWFTGCGNCQRVLPFLKTLESKFRDSNIVFLSVSMDANRKIWKESVKDGTYTTAESINLVTDNSLDKGVNGCSINDPFIKNYHIDGAPTLLLIDKNGKICPTPLDPRIDGGRNLNSAISAVVN